MRKQGVKTNQGCGLKDGAIWPSFILHEEETEVQGGEKSCPGSRHLSLGLEPPTSASLTAPSCSSARDTNDHSGYTQMPSNSSLLSYVGVDNDFSGTTNTNTHHVNQGTMLMNESTGPAQSGRPWTMFAMQEGRSSVARNSHFSQENPQNLDFNKNILHFKRCLV